MQNLMIETYVTLKSLAERLTKDEQGQTAVEYIGVLAFVVAIVVALVGFHFETKLSSIVQTGIDKVGKLM
jgi:Flp pilus assembly pilin Flp